MSLEIKSIFSSHDQEKPYLNPLSRSSASNPRSETSVTKIYTISSPITSLGVLPIHERIVSYAGQQDYRSLSIATRASKNPLTLQVFLNNTHEKFQSNLGYRGSLEKFKHDFCNDSSELSEVNILRFIFTLDLNLSKKLARLDIFSPSFSETLKGVVKAQKTRDPDERSVLLLNLTMDCWDNSYGELGDSRNQLLIPIEQAIIIANNIPIDQTDKYDILKAIAKDKECSSDQLSRIRDIANGMDEPTKAQIFEVIASNKNCSSDQLNQFIDKANHPVRMGILLGVASNDNCSPSQLSRITKIADTLTRITGDHPSHFLIEYKKTDILAAVASNKNCSSDQLSQIIDSTITSTDEYLKNSVFAVAASKENCSSDQLSLILGNKIASSSSESWKNRIFSVAASNDNCSSDQLSSILDNRIASIYTLNCENLKKRASDLATEIGGVGNSIKLVDQWNRMLDDCVEAEEAIENVLAAVIKNKKCSSDQLIQITGIIDRFINQEKEIKDVFTVKFEECRPDDYLGNYHRDNFKGVTNRIDCLIKKRGIKPLLEVALSNKNFSFEQLSQIIDHAKRNNSHWLLAVVPEHKNCSPDQLSQIADIAKKNNDDWLLKRVQQNPKYPPMCQCVIA